MAEDSVEVEVTVPEPEPDPEPEGDNIVVVAPVVVPPAPEAPEPDHSGELAAVRAELEALRKERELEAAAEAQAILDAQEAALESETEPDETIPELEDLEAGGDGVFGGPRFWDGVLG